MAENNALKNATARAREALHSTRGKNILTYLLFVGIAFVFWLLMSLDSEIQRDFDVPLDIESLPDSVTLINQPPATLSVSVKGKGSQMLRFSFGKTPRLKLKFDRNFSSRDNRIVLTRANLDTRLRDYFGAGVSILACRPDSISLYYTTSAPVRLPLTVETDINTALQYVISGPIKVNVDSVDVYSIGDLPRNLLKVETEPVVKSGLKDTMRYEVKVKPIPGARIIPDRVTITVPVEPLISRRRAINIETVNVPDNVGLLTFPSTVDVSYLVPMNAYNETFPIRVYVDYNNIEPGMSKLPLTLSIHPGIAKDAVMAMDSVEFVLEKQ
ncbi:MAG: hypothetical protein J1E63_10765 [Muribaculaceae bacterium]|nr:hypothetical protein [Muribaculaceae bacterium]